MHWKERLERLIPRYALLPLIITPLLNCAVYFGSKLLPRRGEALLLALPWDERIPFLPAAISVYVLSYLFWAVSYLLIARESRRQCLRVLTGDWVAKLICLPFFLLLPTTIQRPDAAGSGLWLWLTRLIYAADSPNNLFPSIHCLESWICWRGLMGCKKVPAWYRGFSLIFALMVCASTVLVKQHVLVDIPAGILLGELGLWAGRLIADRFANKSVFY